MRLRFVSALSRLRLGSVSAPSQLRLISVPSLTRKLGLGIFFVPCIVEIDIVWIIVLKAKKHKDPIYFHLSVRNFFAFLS